MPLSAGILIALFAIQRYGHRHWSACCSAPFALLWFVSLRGAIGVPWQIGQGPEDTARPDPDAMRSRFVTGHGFASFIVLGSVLLAFTGAEALYADMGHFGKSPIRLAWFGVAFPALVLNYFGQGALLIAKSGGARKSILSFRLSRVGSLSDGRSRHRRDDHRLAGDDFGLRTR